MKVGLNIYKRKDGRYEGRYKKGRNGKKLIYGYVYSRTKAVVVEKLLEKQWEYANFLEQAVSGMFLVTWLQVWLESRKGPAVKPSSYAVYERQIRLYMTPLIGGLALSEIGDAQIFGFISELRLKKLSESTITGICRILRCALREAFEQGLIKAMPKKHVWPKQEKRKEARCLEEKEQKALLKAATARNEHEITVALATGIRLGEAAGLKWKDIDFGMGTLHVCRTIQRLPGRSEDGKASTKLTALSPKSSASEREIPLVPRLKSILKELWEKSRQNPEDYVFSAKQSPERPLDPRSIQRRFQRICAAAGIENAHFHTLRHTFATICMEKGFDIESLRCLLGHSSAQITLDCYAHSTMKHRKEIMRKKFRLAV